MMSALMWNNRVFSASSDPTAAARLPPPYSSRGSTIRSTERSPSSVRFLKCRSESCCGSGGSPTGTTAEFDARSDECDATVDDAERAACYNELNKYVTTLEIDSETGLFMLPLTQKPSFYGFTSDLSSNGVSPDANSAGPLVNVVIAGPDRSWRRS